jgi:hypothetical protein
VTSEEDTVDGKNFTSLDDTDVTDENVLRDAKISAQLPQTRQRPNRYRRLTLVLIVILVPPRIQLIILSSFFSFNFLNCLSFCQSLTDPTKTTMVTAIRMATPSTHSI